MTHCTRAAMAIVGICLSWCFRAEGVVAQTEISERDVLAAVAQTHPAMLELEALATDARGARAGAGLWDNPTIWLVRESYSDNIDETRIGFSLPLPFDGRRSMRGKAARFGLAAAEADIAFAALRVRMQVREDFANWYVAGERLRSIEAILNLADDLARMMEARTTAGETSRLAMHRLGLAATELRAASAAAQSDFLAAQLVLQRWFTVPSATAQIQAPELPPLSPTIDAAERPDIAASRNRLAQSEALSRLSGRWVQLPTVDVGWIDPSQSSGGMVFGLSLDVPLFNRNQGARASSHSRLLATQSAYASDTVRARLEWEAARGSYELLREAVLRQPDVNSSADSIVVAATAAFGAGELGITDILEMLRAVDEGRNAALDLVAAALRAHRVLELATGKPLLSY